MLTHDYLRAALSYDRELGTFKWLVRPLDHFKDQSYRQRFNSRFSGKSAGSPAANGYLRIRINDQLYLNHRLAWLFTHGEWPTGFIDHINGCVTDNRIENLRAVDRTDNARNARAPVTNTSGVVGVSFDKRTSRWHAYIGVGSGQRETLGRFESIHDAVLARRSAERQHGYHENHGRFFAGPRLG